MTDVNRGRMHAEMDDTFVVFVVGMRINKLWRVWEWLPLLLAAMPRMLRSLDDHDGMLQTRTEPGIRNWTVVQYWRSFDDLQTYATSPENTHLDQWQRYDRETADSGAVGIWHETYVVDPDSYESIYNNMPARGLGAAGTLEPVDAQSARDRLGRASNDPESA